MTEENPYGGWYAINYYQREILWGVHEIFNSAGEITDKELSRRIEIRVMKCWRCALPLKPLSEEAAALLLFLDEENDQTRMQAWFSTIEHVPGCTVHRKVELTGCDE